MDVATARRTALSVGSSYRVIKDAPAFPNANLVRGETVVLEHIGYSPYDSSFGYTFRADDGSEKCFWLHDDEPLSKVFEVFEA